MEPLKLLSGRRAAQMLGIDIATFRGIVETNGLTAVSSGKRVFWKLSEIQRLGDPAGKDNT